MRGVLYALTGTSENQCQILHHLIEYVLLVLLEKVKNQHGDKPTVCLEDLDEHDRPAIVELIGHWLQKVIGHVKFGGVRFKKFGDEVHVSLLHNNNYVSYPSVSNVYIGMESSINKRRFKLQLYSEVMGVLD